MSEVEAENTGLTSEEVNQLPRVSFREFLESWPPSKEAILEKDWTPDSGDRLKIETPRIELYCSNSICKRTSIFRLLSKNRDTIARTGMTDFYLYYRCSNCGTQLRTFALRISVSKQDDTAFVKKFGEFPSDEEPIPTKLIRMFAADRELFFKGRRCERQGLGIGAAAYYRRVVENQKNRMFDEIIKVCKMVGAKDDVTTTLEAAKRNIQFTAALDTLRSAIPESLLINGVNPMTVLHRLLSRQIHDMGDDECLASARDLRLVLVELAHKIGEVLKDHSEVDEAVKRIMAAHSPAPKPTTS